ncbi:MAG: HAMP domain-containing histidine kinase [Candidatus Melainabacteria bacterium]|nr:HAMP domain-containing histidine kinase [Candidatus Melainabacteria bacterium]
MTASPEPIFIRNMQLISLLSGISTSLIGAVSLLAWTSGSSALVAFKSIPAVPFIISGLALCALQSRKLKTPVHIAGWGFAAVLCFISGHDLVDLLMASSQDSLESMSGGFAFSVLNSLAANDALSLLLISIALLCVDLPNKRFRLADPFTIVAAFLSMMTLLGVIFGIPGFCVFISCLRISLLEGIAIAALSLGVLFIRPEQGLASIMTRDTAGGVLARRLLPAAVLLPLLLGWLRMQGEHLKLYTSEMGLTLLVSALVLIFMTVISVNAWSIDRMDRARLRAIKEMEEEIARRKEVEQRFKDFYSNVSHELRSPITSIQGALQLIEHTMDSQSSQQTIELVGTADISCARLLRLINDLLDVKQIEEGKLHINVARIDTLEVVTMAVDGLKGMAHDADVSLNVVMDALGFVMADEDRIIQVLTNLISNAIKFSKVKDQIVVKISQPNAECIRFAVKDSGPGIAEDQQHKIFGKFEKIDEQDGLKRKGSGLGLAISKGIVEEHGGSIGFNTEIGKGTEFWFELPVADSAKSQSTAESVSTVLAAEKTAL